MHGLAWTTDFMSRVRLVKWQDLGGAYGVKPRDEIVTTFDVLANEEDIWSDAWGLAYDDVLLAHFWHQYSLYGVSAFALPFVFELTERRRSVPAGKELADAVALFAESVSCERPTEERLYALAVSRYLTSIRASLPSWSGTPLASAAMRIDSFLERSPYWS